MSDLPPRLDSLHVRVLRISRFNGMSVLVIAGLGVVFSLLGVDRFGTGCGMLAVAAGMMELHGRSLVLEEDHRGFAWLTGSQLWLIAVITVYAIGRIQNFDLKTTLQLMPKDSLDNLTQAGIDPHDFLLLTNKIGCIILIVVTFVYQGLMWRFYRRAAAALGPEDGAA